MTNARVVTDASFDAEVRHCSRPVIVEYWAQWCGPCRQVAPVLDAIAADYAGQVDLVTVNIDENPVTAGRYGVLAVPTVSLFAGGVVVKQLVGARPKAAFLREFAESLGAPATGRPPATS